MNNFIYETPTKVYFGRDEEKRVGEIVAAYHPNKVLIHYGGRSAKASGLLDRVKESLSQAGLSFVELGGVKANPELSLVREGIALCNREGIDFVLAVGGGSVMDSAKAIANGAANPDVDVWDFCIKKAVPQKTLHKGTIVTIAASGSEMSNSCVITDEKTKQKRGYGCSCNRMDFAIENPELTYSVSPYQTACGAVDIGMHTIERYFCIGEDTYLTDSIAEAVIRSSIKAGKACLRNPRDYAARANMLWASSLAHNDLTHCGRSFLLPVHQLGHKTILERVLGETVYYSPTDMGVNMAGFVITDDAAVRDAAKQEIIRRYYKACCDARQGIIDRDIPARIEVIMQQLGLQEEDRPVIAAARAKAEQRGVPAIAFQLPDGRITTGRESYIMTAAASGVINAIKALAGISDQILLLSQVVLDPIIAMKQDVLHEHNSALTLSEVLIALSLCEATNPTVSLAMRQLSQLHDLEAHCSMMMAAADEAVLRRLGVNITCDPELYT